MTRPRPRIEISTLNGIKLSFYNGVLEKPIIYLGRTDENTIVKTLTHEYIHWVLHKRICEDACFLFDKVAPKEYG